MPIIYPPGVSQVGAPSSYSAAILADTPLAYWRLGELSGTTADNAEGTAAYDGTYTGNYALGGGGALFGDSNAALGFTGTGGYVSVPHAAALNLTTNFSLEAWLYLAANPTATSIIVGKGTGASYSLRMPATTLLPRLHNNSGIPEVRSSVALTLGAWHHIVCTYGTVAGSGKMYVDGVDVGVTVGGGATFTGNTSALLIGSENGALTFGAGDGIDEVAIYGSVLTAAKVAAHYAAGMGSGSATSVVLRGILPSLTVVYTPDVSGGGTVPGAIVYVSSIPALVAALADTANREIVVQDGTYNLESQQYGWLDINGDTYSGFRRTASTAVLVRAQTDGGVTFDGLGTRRDAMAFRGGASYQEWRGFNLARYVPWDDGIIGFGGGNNTTPSHHITLRNFHALSSCIVGAGPVGSYANGHLVYFQQAASGGTHDILIEGLVSEAAVSAQVHFYHDALSGPGTGIIFRNCTFNLNHQAHAFWGFKTWSSALGTVLLEDVTINQANEYGIDHKYGGTFILRRVKTFGSGVKGFHSYQGTYPSVPGFTFDNCSFDSY